MTPLKRIDDAQERIDRIFEIYGQDIPEAYELLNSASRDLAHAVHDLNGISFIGQMIQTYGNMPIEQWDGKELRNFRADFIMTYFDPSIYDLMLNINLGGPSQPDIQVRIYKVYNIITARGGHLLFWS